MFKDKKFRNSISIIDLTLSLYIYIYALIEVHFIIRMYF